MFNWFKLVFAPKKVLAKAVDSMDKLVPLLAGEIEAQKEKLTKLSSTEQAQWAVDKAQEYLRKQFKLEG